MKEDTQNPALWLTRGFWYEQTPDGIALICFMVKLHGKKFVRKLELPKGVKELKPIA